VGAKDVFGIVLRIIGVLCLVRCALDASLALSFTTSVPIGGTLPLSVSTLPVSMAASRSITYLVIGLLLLFGTKVIMRLAYEKE